MNTPFKINRVIAKIDYEKINEKYDFGSSSTCVGGFATLFC